MQLFFLCQQQVKTLLGPPNPIHHHNFKSIQNVEHFVLNILSLPWKLAKLGDVFHPPRAAGTEEINVVRVTQVRLGNLQLNPENSHPLENVRERFEARNAEQRFFPRATTAPGHCPNDTSRLTSFWTSLLEI